MSVAAERQPQPAPRLTAADYSRSILAERSLLKDKSYRVSPVGQAVGRFMRAIRWSGLEQNTRDSYETTLSRLALDHASFDSLERFAEPDGRELLEEFLDKHWGDASQATKANRCAAVRSFFSWAHDAALVSVDPAVKLKVRRGGGRERQAYPLDVLRQLVRRQDNLRDQTLLLLLCQMGLRKNELRLLQVQDVDLGRNELTVHGKGGKVVVMPLAFAELRQQLYLLIQGEHVAADEYLLYPRTERRRPMDPASVHRWFKRCCERAKVGDLELHALRHSAADVLWRETGDLVKAQELLRHSSPVTTRRYLHPRREDLANGMRAVERLWREDT